MPTVYILAATVGVACGIRPLLTLMIIVWEVSARRVQLTDAGLALFSSSAVRWIITAGAIIELVGDSGPAKARRQLARFAPRLVAGAIAGAIVVVGSGEVTAGLACGVAGAIIGCLGGIATHDMLVRALKNPALAGLCENIVVAAAVFALFASGRPL